MKNKTYTYIFPCTLLVLINSSNLFASFEYISGCSFKYIDDQTNATHVVSFDGQIDAPISYIYVYNHMVDGDIKGKSYSVRTESGAEYLLFKSQIPMMSQIHPNRVALDLLSDAASVLPMYDQTQPELFTSLNYVKLEKICYCGNHTYKMLIQYNHLHVNGDFRMLEIGSVQSDHQITMMLKHTDA